MELNGKKNILIVGKGAKASALAKKLSKSHYSGKIFIAPGNGINSEYYENIDIREEDLTGLLKFVLENDVYLTIPVSEKALNSDISAFFQTNGQNIFAPLKTACSIALNNVTGKKFLYKIHAQTSKFGIFDKLQTAEDWIKTAAFPVTIKCREYNNIDDRLACPTITLAREFLDNLFSKNEESVLVEEYTFGHNFTVYYITDGYSAIPMTAVGNYKFAQDGDGGILTNGVGCYCPDYKISQTVFQRLDNVVRNTLVSLDKKGSPYMGILGVECVLTGDDKFYVNEFKPFLQDYDAAAVLNLVEDDLIQVFMACIHGLFADEYEEIKTNDYSSVSALVASRQNNKVIKGFDNIENLSEIDFINIKKTSDEKYLTLKGDSFVLTKTSSTLNRAKEYLYEDLAEIDFDGIKYRKDIAKG